MDLNGDGKLSLDECIQGYDKFFGQNMSEDDIIKMFKAVDTDNSGFIDYTEFVIASTNQKQLLTTEKLQAAFKMFDKDGSGTISSDEVKEVLGFGNALTEAQVSKIVQEVDADGNGDISFDEFEKMMRNLAQ